MSIIPEIKKMVAYTDRRIFFELSGGMYASASSEGDDPNVILFPWKEIFLQYLYEDNKKAPTEEQIETAKSNYEKYGGEARLLIVD